jgi:SAM-dependent methyltransferase
MSFADHFSGVAAQYAAYRPDYPPALAATLAERSPGRALAWDAGCGNGQLSVALARHFEHVIATDPAQAQIQAAEADPRVDYRCEPAETSTLPEACADLAVAAQAAHWFDWPRYVTEVARVARPGALVALVGYGALVVPGEAATLIGHYYSVTAGPYWPKGRELVENLYRDLAWPWPEVEAPPIDMVATWTRDELLGYVATWSSTQRLTAAQGPAPYRELCEAVARVWPDGENREVRWPLAIRLARR